MACVVAPGEADSSHEIHYGDGAVLRCPLGSTAFIDARFGGQCQKAHSQNLSIKFFICRRAFDLLTPHERERALRTNVVYATHPFRRLLLVDYKCK